MEGERGKIVGSPKSSLLLIPVNYFQQLQMRSKQGFNILQIPSKTTTLQKKPLKEL